MGPASWAIASCGRLSNSCLWPNFTERRAFRDSYRRAVRRELSLSTVPDPLNLVHMPHKGARSYQPLSPCRRWAYNTPGSSVLRNDAGFPSLYPKKNRHLETSWVKCMINVFWTNTLRVHLIDAINCLKVSILKIDSSARPGNVKCIARFTVHFRRYKLPKGLCKALSQNPFQALHLGTFVRFV